VRYSTDLARLNPSLIIPGNCESVLISYTRATEATTIVIDNLFEYLSTIGSFEFDGDGVDFLSMPSVIGYSAASSAAHSISTASSSGTLILTWSPGFALK